MKDIIIVGKKITRIGPTAAFFKFSFKGAVTERKWISGDKWVVPREGETGKVENVKSSKVFEAVGSNRYDRVILKTSNNSANQMWTRSKATPNGYFTLVNVMTGLVLTDATQLGNLFNSRKVQIF